jgi:outer membrane protein OmpA-like peptidoglycan-associated protein/opacity protein-like surface antigen
MQRAMRTLILLAMVTQLGVLQSAAQQSPDTFNRYGRWSFGLHGGINQWKCDFEKRKLSGAADLSLRYSITRQFSLGLLAGYDVLQTISTGSVKPPEFTSSETYVEAKGYTADLVAWFHFNHGKWVSPYVYAGVGTFMFKRKISGGVDWPDSKMVKSIHIPVGVGFEWAVSKHASIVLDLGARILDDHSDNWAGATKSGTDWYPTARAGLNFYFGKSDDDDDDGDGLTNAFEKKVGTDPNKADTDDDGLSDRDEGIKYHTNPLRADSDVDGLKDGEEALTYSTDPLKPDTDGDRLVDGDEVLTYHTDPLKVDTDGDGLADGDEVRTYHSDPLKADTDGDGLTDSDEVNKFHTDPVKSDTDGGGIGDGAEVAAGSNPLDPKDDVLKKDVIKVEAGGAIVLEGLAFASGKAVITPESETILEKAYNTMAQNPEIEVEIRGYTDNVGSRATNLRISAARANSVRTWLIQKGIEPRRITAKGLGPNDPIGDNNVPAGRNMNRRVEFVRTK